MCERIKLNRFLTKYTKLTQPTADLNVRAKTIRSSEIDMGIKHRGADELEADNGF